MIPKSEVRTKEWLSKNGYDFIRAGRSFGPFDFAAWNRGEVLLIQAKCRQGPYGEELAALKAYKNYPKGYAKKLIFIWKAYQREPIIQKVR